MVTNGGKWCKLMLYHYHCISAAVFNGKGAASMLIGTYSHALDSKGRVFIPSKWRESIGDVLIVMHWIIPGRDQSCLFAMSLNEWDQFSARLSQLPMTDMAAQAVKRRLYANASACEIDRQGRILLPSQLRDLAGIRSDASLIGVGNRIELWDPSMLAKHYADTSDNYGDALAHLSQIGV